MAVPVSADEFLDLVRKSGVTDERKLDNYLAKVRAGDGFPKEPAKTAGVLVRDGYLTNFQAEQILQGKWRRFTIGKYKVLEKLGSGGMGSVYLCEHKLMRRRVAVKVLPTNKANDPSALDRFYREARAVASLDHPNIVHAYDIDQDEQIHFLVMEYVDGANLQEIVKRCGTLSVLRACHYIRQSALGLHHAFESGLLHRDIKPANILVDRTGVVKVLDMGLARFFNDEEDMLTKKYDENVLGTADYLSPEQALDSHAVDIRSDIYSLGATFYFILTGRTPYGEGTVAQKLLWHQTKQPRPISEFRVDVPPELIAIIHKMMEKSPENRFAVPLDVADALAELTQVPIGPPPEHEMPRLSPAAMGITVGESPETQVARSVPMQTPVTPTPSLRGGSTPQPQPTSGSAHRPVAPTPSSWVPQAPSAFPAPPAPAPSMAPKPVVPTAPAPAPVPQPTWTSLNVPLPNSSPQVPVAVDESPALWNATIDTIDTGRDRTDSRTSLRAPARRGKGRSDAEVSKLFAWLGLLLVAGFIAGGAWLVISLFFKGDAGQGQIAPAIRTLVVSRTQSGAYQSLAAALQNAREGDTIEIHEEEIVEHVVIKAGLKNSTKITLKAKANHTVRWRGGRADTPLINCQGAEDFKFLGTGITLDGRIDDSKMLQDLVQVTSHCAGLTIQDVHLQNFRRSGVLIANAEGRDPATGREAAVQLVNLNGVTPSKEARAATVYFFANPNVTPAVNNLITIRDVRLNDDDKLAVRAHTTEAIKLENVVGNVQGQTPVP